MRGDLFFIGVFVISACAIGTYFTFWLANYIFLKDDGTAEMRNVSDPIKEGAEGFLKVQYGAISRMAFLLSFVILASYSFRPSVTGKEVGVEILGNSVIGIIATLSFIMGAACSALVGYVSMWVSASTNIRVCSAARRSYGETLEVCFRGGAFSAVLCITLCVFGVSMLFFVLNIMYVNTGILKSTDIPMLMVGYGFGASFVALFMQLGGGIYTKAADVGADMVGKIEVYNLTFYYIIS